MIIVDPARLEFILLTWDWVNRSIWTVFVRAWLRDWGTSMCLLPRAPGLPSTCLLPSTHQWHAGTYSYPTLAWLVLGSRTRTPTRTPRMWWVPLSPHGQNSAPPEPRPTCHGDPCGESHTYIHYKTTNYYTWVIIYVKNKNSTFINNVLYINFSQAIIILSNISFDRFLEMMQLYSNMPYAENHIPIPQQTQFIDRSLQVIQFYPLRFRSSHLLHAVLQILAVTKWNQTTTNRYI